MRSWIAASCLLALILRSTAAESFDWKQAPPDQRRDAVVAAVIAGDVAAARYLVLAGMWDDAGAINPDSPAVSAWKAKTDEVDGITTAQIFADLLANWAVRHETDLGKEVMQARMREARDIMQSYPLHHPIIIQELSWLCTDVPPVQKRTRELRVLAAALFAKMPQPSDPLLAARWLLAKISDGGEVNQIDHTHQTANALAETAGDSKIVIESLWSWINDKTQALAVQETRIQAEYDERSVVVLYSQLATALHQIGDAHGEASAAFNCGTFLKSHHWWDPAAAMFSTAAKLYGGLGDKRSQGRCLSLQSASMLALNFDPDRTKNRIELMHGAIACFAPGKDDSDLAQAHTDLAQLLPSGSDEALSEFREACRLYQGLGDGLLTGRAMLNTAECLFHRRAMATERKDTEAAGRIVQEQLAMLAAGLEGVKGAPPDNLIAYSAESLAQLNLELFPDRLDEGIAEMITAADLWRGLGDFDKQFSILERCAKLCAEHGRKEKSAEIWKRLGDLAFAHRSDPDGPQWLDRAADYFKKSGIPSPPVSKLTIDEKRDETQGREASRLHELCQSVGTAKTPDEAKGLLEEISHLLGCTLSLPWIPDLWQCQHTWHLSHDDCRCLLRALAYPECGLWAADLITQLGGIPGAELLTARLKELPNQTDRDLSRLNGMLYAISRFTPEIARANLGLVLPHLTMDSLRLAVKLLPKDELKPVLNSGLASENFDILINVLQLLNRDAGSIDSSTLRNIALRTSPAWGPSREALLGLILQGRKDNEAAILGILADPARHSEVRSLAIVGAGYLRLEMAIPTFVALLSDPKYGTYAARALTYMGSRSHLEILRSWAKSPPADRYDDRPVIAHVGLWCLIGDGESRTWLIDHLTQPTGEFADFYVIRALGWGFGQRAADLMTELLVSHFSLDNWIAPGSNRILLQRSLSRLELSGDQLVRLERQLGVPIPERCMDTATPSEFTLDGEPPAPLLIFRKTALKP